jgi:putative SOS response-associated peptidase YedK
VKLQRIVIRKAREVVPIIPDSEIWENPQGFILFNVRDGKVTHSTMFEAHKCLSGVHISGFTHYARIPRWIRP